ncbi:MAG: ABC transporter substrate-binding protein [Promethearchaeota archaeon]
MNIGHLSTAYHTNFILMENKNLENDLNKEINWTLFGTGPAMLKAFNRRELDIGYMGLPPAIIGIDKGVSIKCIAGGHVEGTIMISKKEFKNLFELKDDLYEVFAQFKGKTVGVPSKGSIHDVILNYYLDKYDLYSKVAVQHYKQAEFIALDMKKGILDGGVGTPALAAFSSTVLNSHIIIPPDKLWKNNPSYGIFCSEKLIENHPEILITFLFHHKKATSLIRDSPSIAASKIVKTFEIINENYAKSILKISPKYCIALSKGYVNATMNFVNTLYNLGYIKRQLKINNIFNFNFVKKMHPEKHHY